MRKIRITFAYLTSPKGVMKILTEDVVEEVGQEEKEEIEECCELVDENGDLDVEQLVKFLKNRGINVIDWDTNVENIILIDEKSDDAFQELLQDVTDDHVHFHLQQVNVITVRHLTSDGRFRGRLVDYYRDAYNDCLVVVGRYGISVTCFEDWEESLVKDWVGYRHPRRVLEAIARENGKLHGVAIGDPDKFLLSVDEGEDHYVLYEIIEHLGGYYYPNFQARQGEVNFYVVLDVKEKEKNVVAVKTSFRQGSRDYEVYAVKARREPDDNLDPDPVYTLEDIEESLTFEKIEELRRIIEG